MAITITTTTDRNVLEVGLTEERGQVLLDVLLDPYELVTARGIEVAPPPERADVALPGIADPDELERDRAPMTTYDRPVGAWTLCDDEEDLEAAVDVVRGRLATLLELEHLAPLQDVKVRTTTYLAGPNPEGVLCVLAETVALELTNPPLLEHLSPFTALGRRLGAARRPRPSQRHLGAMA